MFTSLSEVHNQIRKFTGWHELWRYVEGISGAEWRRMREAGRSFLSSSGGMVYFNGAEVLAGALDS